MQSWTDVIAGSLLTLWYGFVSYVPNVIGALIVLIIGLIVASGLSIVVQKFFEAIRFDAFLEKLGVKPYFNRAGLKLHVSYFFGRLVYWFIVLGFLLAASNSLGLTSLSLFLMSVVAYLPNVIAAVLIMLATVVVATFLRRTVVASVLGANLSAPHFLGALVWWTVIIFGFLTALTQLNIAAAIIQTLVTGFIAMLALAGGLAFGLGGKDYAHHLLDKLKDRTEGKY